MKKRILALLACLCLCAGLLAACGSSSSETTTAAQGETSAETTAAEETTTAAATGEVVDNGTFKATCPEGWYVYKAEDSATTFTAEELSEDDYLSCQYIDMASYDYAIDSDTYKTTVEFAEAMFDDFSEVSVTINGIEAPGITGELFGEQETMYFYPINDSTTIQITTYMSPDESIVQAVMNSITLD